jgi:tRNA1(Val) A37 N6-methylase TrmN6
MTSDALVGETTDDAVLGGRLHLLQPVRGHRVGHDAILLAAATPARPGEQVVDLGAGVGAAGLTVARRVPDAIVTLVEISPDLTALATENAQRNGLTARALTLDATASVRAFAEVGLEPETAARVMMNPPFNDPVSQLGSPDPQRRVAHVAPQDVLARWVATAVRLLRPGGTLTLIWRAEGLFDVLRALENGFGAVMVLPVHGKPEQPAIRVLVRAIKASRAPLTLQPALVLNDVQGRPTAEAEAVLRDGAVLPLGEI